MDLINDVISRLPKVDDFSPLPEPPYVPREGRKLALAVASMKDHMTDEGWQIMDGLGYAGYLLCGHDLPVNQTDVDILLSAEPSVVFLQDKREWDVRAGNFREPRARFTNVNALARDHGAFKVTILKDAQQNPPYHAEAALEMGCHAWVVYYNTEIVQHVAPYVRPEHLIRTYHTIDPKIVPPYSEARSGCLLSGAVSGAYPLRQALVANFKSLPETQLLKHPGYHRRGCATPGFFSLLSRYKVAICTASRYGYALRKIMEATAAGCVVVTNLPADEVLPAIDGNLVRVNSKITIKDMAQVLSKCLDEYNPDRQDHYASMAIKRYSFKTETARLARLIEHMRASYK